MLPSVLNSRIGELGADVNVSVFLWVTAPSGPLPGDQEEGTMIKNWRGL